MVMIGTMMVPFQLYMAPLLQVSSRLGLYNTHVGLLVLQVSTGFGIFLLRQAYLGVPKELEESAYLDGASQFYTWRRIVLPLIRPSLVTLAIFSFMNTWGDYLWPLLNANQEHYTIPVGIASMAQNFDGANIKLISAVSILAVFAHPDFVYFLAEVFCRQYPRSSQRIGGCLLREDGSRPFPCQANTQPTSDQTKGSTLV